MITAPFSASTGAAVNSGYPFGIAYTVNAITPGAGTFELVVTGGSVTWSDRRAPMTTADLEVAIPTSAQRAALDPRAGARAEMIVTYTSPSGAADTQRVWNLGLRRRTINRERGTMSLYLASDEARVIDNSQRAVLSDPGTPETGTETDVAGWISSQVYACVGPDTGRDRSAVPALTSTAAPITVPDIWDQIESFCDAFDLVCFDAGDRVIRVEYRKAVSASDAALTVAAGPNGILLDAQPSIDRDDWANMVTVRHEWTTTTGAQKVVYGTAQVTSGPYQSVSYGPAGVKHSVVVRTAPGTTAGAKTAAAAILARALSRSRSLQLRTLPAWWVRPGHTIEYVSDAGVTERHLASEIVHDLANLTMEVTTRVPDTDSTIGT